MTKFYANENFPIDLVKELRQLGYDVLTSYEAGQANQSISDEEVLNFAHEQQRVMITLNREDFISLHKQGQNHSGIIICKEDRDYKGQGGIIYDFLIQNTQPLTRRLIRIKKQNQKGSSTQVFVIQEY
ncbi:MULTISPECIES: DUF5615 family PIN-like protein [Nostoc]|uniref:DUF5615 family PIN-like protein n=1 Tax=Nostoc paludosum FACHB-159 TaxID=2692908 RepID=A0ABR8KFV2_9NOSO|nr:MULTISPECIES: DUF5615 family PIN-like protein [Nostoc]MBD2681127.1 DUF5615 family PIN-like protein [Nostoc sp. FACHB-857]MBD2737604.1 DUF5615 family PIN-like protein [Nostoc paludosum FACHB-159]